MDIRASLESCIGPRGPRRAAPFWTAAAIMLVVVACGGGGDGGAAPRAEWVFETTTEGDVTTVRTIAGSVWGGAARLEEQLSIGIDQGEQPYMFGRISGMASYEDRLYVLDTSVPVVRVYDAQGRHSRDIGSEGDGPGEFRSPDGLLIDDDGRMYVRDMRQARITIFENDGGFIDTWPLDAGFIIIPAAFVMTVDGTVYSPGRVGPMPTEFRGPGAIQMGMIPRGPADSAAEPIPRPAFDYEPPRFTREQRTEGNFRVMMMGVPFAADIVWALAPSGALLAGVGNEYSFDITTPGGPVTRVAMDQKPVAIGGRERDWHIEQTSARMRDGNPEWMWTGPEMATVKPAFDQLLPDHSGRVWVGRPGPGIENSDCEKDIDTGVWLPACWMDSRLYDVFDLEGSYLGPVEVPAGFRLDEQSWIKGDVVLTALEDESGVITVKRFRLVVPTN